MARDTNRTAVITGGTSDIGKALAVTFAAAGYSLCLVTRGKVDPSRILGQSAYIEQITCCPVDLSDEPGLTRAFGQIAAQCDSLDVLINNAAVTIPGDIRGIREADLNKMLAVNLRAPILAARALIPAMLRRGGGDIVNIASAAGLEGLPSALGYGSSKAGLINATASINASMNKHNVRATVICPETVNTSFLDPGNFSEEYRRRLLQPDEIAHLVYTLVCLPRHMVFGPISVRSSRM